MEVCTIFSTEEINDQLKRILDFPMFQNSPVLRRFLEFIIDETIHKKQLSIKEYSIAINVLYRSRDFNPNLDSIVRIHAGRLRRALNDYYLTQGIYDPIIIRIPKGCYVPEFVESGTVKPMADRLASFLEQSIRPLVAIFPFRVATKRGDMNEFLLVLKEQLSEGLLSFRDISVIGYYTAEMNAKIAENILEGGKSAGADYIITGSLTYIGQRIRILINLLVTGTGEVLLCKSFDKNIESDEVFEIKDDIVQNFIGFAGDCYGVIQQEWHKHLV
jgi:TolB-like protein